MAAMEPIAWSYREFAQNNEIVGQGRCRRKFPRSRDAGTCGGRTKIEEDAGSSQDLRGCPAYR